MSLAREIDGVEGVGASDIIAAYAKYIVMHVVDLNALSCFDYPFLNLYSLVFPRL